MTFRDAFRVSIVLLSLAICACGDSQRSVTEPTGTSPSTPPTSPASGIFVRLDVAIDGAGARDAVASLSEVLVDASASTGRGGLTYSIDFGDGTTVSGPTAGHVYTGPGTFVIRCEAKDTSGQTAVESRSVVVKTMVGNWLYVGYVPRSRRIEVWRLAITGQTGLGVRGVYRNTDERDKPFTGTLTRPRNLQVAIDDGPSFDGAVPARVSEEGEVWTLATRNRFGESGSIDFRPVPADANAPAPDAVFRVRLDSFGAGQAIAGLSPIDFDGSTSHGNDLSYFIEFGDGTVSNETRAVHPVDQAGEMVARLTVVDRFGRSDSETFRYVSFALNDPFPTRFLTKYAIAPLPLELIFKTRSGLSYTGTVRYRNEPDAVFVANLTGERDIHIASAELGLEFHGYLAIGDAFYHNLHLTETRGPTKDLGTTWDLVTDYDN